jgi:hypothetical protein
MNRRPPLWYRVASRPSWSRGDPYKVTDYDPGAAMNIALNRVEIAMAHREARMLKMIERIAAARARRPR